MFEDKLALLEKEFDKQQAICSELYKEVAIQGNVELKPKYEKELEKLTTFSHDIMTLKQVMNNTTN
jgi:tRNA (Thr-GGU) A37 N-methylase